MEWRVQGVSVWVLLLLGGGCLQFTWADQNGTVSHCLPLGEATQSGFHFFSTKIPYYGVLSESCEVRANYSTVGVFVHSYSCNALVQLSSWSTIRVCFDLLPLPPLPSPHLATCYRFFSSTQF